MTGVLIPLRTLCCCTGFETSPNLFTKYWGMFHLRSGEEYVNHLPASSANIKNMCWWQDT